MIHRLRSFLFPIAVFYGFHLFFVSRSPLSFILALCLLRLFAHSVHKKHLLSLVLVLDFYTKRCYVWYEKYNTTDKNKSQ